MKFVFRVDAGDMQSQILGTRIRDLMCQCRVLSLEEK